MAEEAQAADVAEEQEAAPAPESAPEPVGESLLAGKYKDVASLETGYKELQAKLGERPEVERDKLIDAYKAELRKGVPEKPGDYVYTPPEGVIPEGANFEFKTDDPTFTAWQEWSHEIGLTPEQFNQATTFYVQNELAMMPNKAAELEKLGENAQARLDRLDMWAGRHLSPEGYNAITLAASNADTVMALEQMIKMTRDPSMVTEDAKPDGPLSYAELQDMQRQARQMTMSAERVDLENKIADGFKRLASSP
tara:strand:- start:1092 stop:1847 length:756 start_codon:yes stop_codon:yes gene_type:complete